MTLLSDDAVETLVSEAAAAAGIGSATVLTTGAVGAGALVVDRSVDGWFGSAGGGLKTDLLVSVDTVGAAGLVSDELREVTNQ